MTKEKTFGIRITEGLRERIQEIAIKKGTTMTEIARTFILEGLEREGFAGKAILISEETLLKGLSNLEKLGQDIAHDADKLKKLIKR